MPNKPNPELQKAVFGHIKSHILEFGYPPTTRDLMAYTGRNSSSHMHSVLRKLEADGLITMEAGKSRTIRLVGYKIILVKWDEQETVVENAEIGILRGYDRRAPRNWNDEPKENTRLKA